MIDRLLRPGRGTTILRRALSISCYLVSASVAWAGLPVWLTITVLIDLARDLVRARPRRPRFIISRIFLFGATFLLCEMVGVVAAFLLWLAYLVRRPAIDTYRRWNFRVQQAWGATLLGAGRAIFGFRYSVTGQETVTPGPVILMLRHSSLADTVLALAQISKPHGIILRYVLKRPLLFDPCIDIVGQRLINMFVQRGSGSRAQIRGVAGLAERLGPSDGVLIYPEGTRFSEEKRATNIARLRHRKRFTELAFAESLLHVLPPLRSGTNALLTANAALETPADILFCGHAGFEGSATVGDIVEGNLLHRTIRIHFWRVPAADVPETEAGRTEWFNQEWQRMDRLIGELSVLKDVMEL